MLGDENAGLYLTSVCIVDGTDELRQAASSGYATFSTIQHMRLTSPACKRIRTVA